MQDSWQSFVDLQTDQQLSKGVDLFDLFTEIVQEDSESISSLCYGTSESFAHSHNDKESHESLRRSRRQHKHPRYVADAEDDLVNPFGVGHAFDWLLCILHAGQFLSLLHGLTLSRPVWSPVCWCTNSWSFIQVQSSNSRDQANVA